MSQIKWIKITTDMFEDEKIDFIDSLPDKDTILILWIKLLTLAGKVNDRGLIYLTQEIPYSEEMLSHKFKRPINTVKLAMETFRRLGMVFITEAGHTAIANWEKHQNIEQMKIIREQTKNRVQKHRQNQRLITCNASCNADVTQQNKNKNKKKEKNTHQPKTADVSDFQQFIDFYFSAYREKFQTDPPFKGGRDGQTVKTLLKVMTVNILKNTVTRYLETEDLFFKKNGYDIPRFEKFLDGIKCGAYETEESRPYNVSKSYKNSTEDDVLLDPATGNPVKTIAVRATRKTVQEKFKEGLI